MERAICAVATAVGEGGIAIVRASGEGVRSIFEQAFRPFRQREILSHRLMYGHAVAEDESNIDEVMAVFMAAPNSYTREDMFEIHCHGGGVCARRVLKRLMELGASPAQPGEFTRRAFMNGRIDLSRAEAVMSLIGAKSDAAARSSLRQLEGGVSGFVKEASEALKEIMAQIEACTDFPEEVEEQAAARQVRRDILSISDKIRSKIDERGAKLLREGASIVLAGRPNVGKSSLMNALLNQERAIVTDVAGTTRDVLTERICLGGIYAELSDTAGRRNTSDPVEKIGVARAARAAETADIVLIVIDGSQELSDEDRALLQERDERSIVCINKTDLETLVHIDGAFEISAADGSGMNELLSEMERRVKLGGGMEERMTEQRHILQAKKALDALNRAVDSIDSRLALDLCEIDLRDALGALSEITGEDASEEVIDRVFARFCVGK